MVSMAQTVELIEERGFPVEITEGESIYAPFNPTPNLGGALTQSPEWQPPPPPYADLVMTGEFVCESCNFTLEAICDEWGSAGCPFGTRWSFGGFLENHPFFVLEAQEALAQWLG